MMVIANQVDGRMRKDSVETTDSDILLMQTAVMPGLKLISCNKMSLKEILLFTYFYVPGIIWL